MPGEFYGNNDGADDPYNSLRELEEEDLTPEDALKVIESARNHGVLFPVLADSESVYKRLAVLVHPDKHDKDAAKDRYESAFKKLAEFYAQASGKTLPPQAAVFGKWVVEKPLGRGTISDIFEVVTKDGRGFMKVSAEPRFNPFLEDESANLRSLKKLGGAEAVYLPDFKESIRIDKNRANIFGLPKEPTELRSLDNIGSFLGKIPFRHIVWMGNRLFSALGYAHVGGVVHGGVTPDHSLYNVKNHGMLLVGWGSSVAGPKPAKIVNPAYRDFYPKEVSTKRNLTPATDIFMAAKTLKAYTDGVPDSFEGLFDWCLAESPTARPQDAWKLQELWAATAKKEFGPNKFVDLVLPTV